MQAAIEAGAGRDAARAAHNGRGAWRHEHVRRQDRLKTRERFTRALRNRESAAVEPQRDIGSGEVADRGPGGLILNCPMSLIEE